MLLILFYFALGLTSGIFLSGYIPSEQLPAGNIFAVPEERLSPNDHIKNLQIKVYDNKVEISLGNYQGGWARFAGGNSMDPVLDESANSVKSFLKRQMIFTKEILLPLVMGLALLFIVCWIPVMIQKVGMPSQAVIIPISLMQANADFQISNMSP